MQATVLAPHNAVAWAGKARCEDYLQEYSASVADYTTAIRFAPTNSIYYLRRGLDYHHLGDSADALADYSTAIRLDPRNVDAWFDRGGWYYDQGQYASAIPNDTQAIHLDPTWWQAYFNRGEGEERLAQDAAAIADFTIYLKHTPRAEARDAYSWRGSAYVDLGQYAKALADYQQAIAIGPAGNVEYFDAAIAAYNLRQYVTAEDYFTQAIAYLPNDAASYFYRGCSHVATGDKAEAIADLRQALALYTRQGNAVGAKRASDELATLGITS
jgi:tetratricopeptide (TPR) repeat protein